MDELSPDELERPPSPNRRRLRGVITLLVVAALVVAFGLEGSGFILRSSPAPEVRAKPVGNTLRLAVVNATGALSSMDAAGGSIVTYPAPGLTFVFPAWSPDGTRIAAIGTDGSGTSLDVFVPPAVGSGSAAAAPTVAYRSPDHPAFYLYWAPDGTALAFLTTEPDGIALRRVLSDAGAPDTTVRRGAPMYWQWVDPTRLLVHSGGSAPDALVGEVGLDGTLAEPAAIEAGAFRVPALSGSGRYLAYASSGSGGSAAVVVESRDGILHHEVPVFGVAAFEFDPAGDTLAFVAADKAGKELAVPLGPLRAVDPATGSVRTLLDGSVVGFFWAPDGRTIAALRVNEPADTNVAGRSGVAALLAKAGGPPAGAAQRPAAAGIALRITFVDVASGAVRSERIGRLSDLYINQILPYFDQYALSHRFWAPDNSAIVLPIDDDKGVSQITIIPADGSGTRIVADGVSAFWSP